MACLWIAWASVCFFDGRAAAQSPNPGVFDVILHRLAADGLPQNSVTKIIQAQDGFLWVGTKDGLFRFDGVRFLHVNLPGTRRGSFWINDIHEDKAKRLWIATQEQGLYCLSEGTTTQWGKATGLVSDTITSLAVDSHNNVWIGTPQGLDRWNGAGFDHFTSEDGLPNNVISSVYVARSGTAWITTREGVCVYREGHIHPFEFEADSLGRSPEFLGIYEDQNDSIWAFGDTYLINLKEGKRFNYFSNGEAPSMRIWSFYEGADGRLWFGTSGHGLFQFADNRFQPAVIRDGRLPDDVRAICQDREGNLWLGTEGDGLVQLCVERLRVSGADQGGPKTPATSLAQDAAGRIWAGYERDGIFTIDGNGRFEQYTNLDLGGLTPGVNSICVSEGSRVWIATRSSGLVCLQDQRCVHFTTANGLSDNEVTALATGTNGTVWAGLVDGTLYRYTGRRMEKLGNLQEAITVLQSSPTGLWIGTSGGGLWRYTNKQFLKIAEAATFSNRGISGFCSDAAGRLWIGSKGGGLGCLTGNSLKTWNVSSGLPDATILSLGTDSEANLWLTTSLGIYIIRNEDLSYACTNGHFLSVRSIQKSETADHRSAPLTTLLSREGRLWFATSQGVVYFDPRGWKPDSTAPPIYLESAAVNGRTIAGSSKEFQHGPFTFPSQVEALDIEFTAPYLTAPGTVRFLYKLEGFDLDWVAAGTTSRQAHYGQLPYGNYRFRLNVADPDGKWKGVGVSFSFLIPPPIWLRWWALLLESLLAATFLTFSVRAFFNRRLRRKLLQLERDQAMTRERMRIAQDMHDEIGSKLARISYLSEGVKTQMRGPDLFDGKIESLAQTSRNLLQSLDQMVWTVNPRNDTLEHLVSYLEQYSLEYFQDTAIQCNLNLNSTIPSTPLSADSRHNLLRAVEEALSNIVKHSGANTVTVEMGVVAENFEISIRDNGSGFEPSGVSRSGRERHGLSGFQSRLEAIGGTFELKSQKGAGTMVLFRIPLKKVSIKRI